MKLSFAQKLFCVVMQVMAVQAYAETGVKPVPHKIRPAVRIKRPAPARPLVLIYKGPGSCRTEDGDAGDSGFGCSEASAQVAKLAGFQFKYVGPTDSPDFSKAKLWVQPGGIATKAANAMSDELKDNLKKFVANGGGYVGFCAGAFMATEMIGSTHTPGLGIFPGQTIPYQYETITPELEYGFPLIKWNGKNRHVYFEGGPYLFNFGSDAKVTGEFSDGYAVSARAAFGKGRVYLTGAHPEAPAIWYKEDNMRDPDGSDLSLAVEMFRWSAGFIK